MWLLLIIELYIPKQPSESGGQLAPVYAIEYIRLLKLDTYTEEWRLIEYNWIEPENEYAYQRLYDEAILQYSLL